MFGVAKQRVYARKAQLHRGSFFYGKDRIDFWKFHM